VGGSKVRNTTGVNADGPPMSIPLFLEAPTVLRVFRDLAWRCLGPLLGASLLFLSKLEAEVDRGTSMGFFVINRPATPLNDAHQGGCFISGRSTK
jgi:hypothetical protein